MSHQDQILAALLNELAELKQQFADLQQKYPLHYDDEVFVDRTHEKDLVYFPPMGGPALVTDWRTEEYVPGHALERHRCSVHCILKHGGREISIHGAKALGWPV